MDADYESSMIEADDVVLKDRITMYQSYIDEIESVKNRNFSLDYKRRRSRYISDYELFSEIYYLESIARKKCESSSYSDYMYEKYSGAIGIYNTDNLIKVGHSEKDDIFSNGTANLVCSICKISWMITYLEALERKINELLSSKQGKSLLDKIKIDGEISKIKKVSSNSFDRGRSLVIISCSNDNFWNCCFVIGATNDYYIILHKALLSKRIAMVPYRLTDITFIYSPFSIASDS